ncbi:putative 26S proteasome regulatory subunit [Mortierella sp. NVP85]|nr:putative 26S proteasome regulatory subunit [Mortierella sp. NVP85]
MEQIEKAIHDIHAEALAEKKKREEEKERKRQEEAAANASSSSSTSTSQQQAQDSEDKDLDLSPFARVNSVAPDSPAKEAGLLEGDMIVVFGTVNVNTPNVLPSLGAHVQSRENKPILVKVRRAGSERLQSLILVPKQGWGGRGTLGCHILPV